MSASAEPDGTSSDPGEPQRQEAFRPFPCPAKLAMHSLSLARSRCLLLHEHLIRCHGPCGGHTWEWGGGGGTGGSGQGADIPAPVNRTSDSPPSALASLRFTNLSEG